MAQNWTEDPFNGSHVATIDLQNMEYNFNAFKSSFSGSAAPSFAEAFTIWFDTAKKIAKVRDSGDSAWLGILSGDIDSKLWLHRNDTCEGWVIDTSVTDKVLAVKGGSQAYNISGGNIAGTWVWPEHYLTEAEMASHTHTVSYATGNHSHTMTNIGTGSSSPYDGGSASSHSHALGSTGGGDAHSHGGSTLRIYAAVGTLQYPDLP